MPSQPPLDVYHRFETPVTLGIVGGGQLGRMLLPACYQWDVRPRVLDHEGAPAQALTPQFTPGDLTRYEDVLAFGRACEVITIEIEKANLEALAELEGYGKLVRPSVHVLEIARDKGRQKQFFQANGFPTAAFRMVEDPETLTAADLPLVQKSRTGGYDGRGVQVLEQAADLAGRLSGPSVLEERVAIKHEISVVVARNAHGDVAAYPPVEMVFDPAYNLLDVLLAPARIDNHTAAKATALAEQMAEALELQGLMAVEFFVDRQERLLVNEIAPRLHNSGHHTLEASATSQFEQHLRAVLNLPLGETRLHHAGAMVNLLGHPERSGPPHYRGLPEALAHPNVHVHLYGKQTSRPGRKMGHFTVLDHDLEKAEALARRLKESLYVYVE